jgi:hypothetical protein
MTFLKRILGLIFLLLSLAGIGLCIAGVVGIWRVRPPLVQRTEHTFVRVDAALNDANNTLVELSGVLERATQNLKEVRDAAPPPRTSLTDRARQDMAVRVVQQVVPGAGNIRATLQKLIETTAVANSILGDLQELPTGTLPFLNRDALSQMDDHVAKISSATEDLRNIFGGQVAPADADANEVISRIDILLQRITGLIDVYRTKVDEVRSRIQTLQTQVQWGLQWGPLIATGLLVWFTIAQISLLVHAWSWLRGPSAAKA